MRKSVKLLVVCLLSVCSFAQAQNGLARANAQPSPVQPLPAPVLPAAPATRASVLTPVSSSTSTPLPAGNPVAAPVDLRREALDRIAPLTPDEIKSLRRDLTQRGNAMTEPMEPPPKPVRRQVRLDLSPGASPEIVRAAFAQGSVITFIDAAGRPWPVVHADNFAPTGFDIATFGVNGVSVGVKTQSAKSGNIAILLDGLSAPVSFGIVGGQREVDYSIEVQLPRYLPNSAPPVGVVEQLPALGAAELLDFLMNTPPREAKALTVDVAGIQAWQVGPHRMIVRAQGLLASPAWSRRQSSAAGVSVYDLPITPVMLLAAQGQLSTVRVSGFTATKEQR